MNQRKLLISALFIAVIMANMSILPALAKPYTITVTVKDIDTGKKVGAGLDIMLQAWPSSGEHYTPQWSTTDSSGKVTFRLDPAYGPYDSVMASSGPYTIAALLDDSQNVKLTLESPSYMPS